MFARLGVGRLAANTFVKAGNFGRDQARAVEQLGMLVRFGVSSASVEQPGVQLLPRVRASLGPTDRLRSPPRSRGAKNRSRTTPTWFSTWPFSQPAAYECVRVESEASDLGVGCGPNR